MPVKAPVGRSHPFPVKFSLNLSKCTPHHSEEDQNGRQFEYFRPEWLCVVTLSRMNTPANHITHGRTVPPAVCCCRMSASQSASASLRATTYTCHRTPRLMVTDMLRMQGTNGTRVAIGSRDGQEPQVGEGFQVAAEELGHTVANHHPAPIGCVGSPFQAHNYNQMKGDECTIDQHVGIVWTDSSSTPGGMASGTLVRFWNPQLTSRPYQHRQSRDANGVVA